MNSQKIIFYKILRYTGIPLVLREIIQKKKVTIIAFHDPEVETFLLFIKYVKAHYNVIPLSQYTEALQKQKKTLPKSLIITLDDGHKNNYRLMEIIKEYKIPVTIFVCSDIVGTNRHYWWTHITDQYVLKKLKRTPEIEKKETYKKYGYDYQTEYNYAERQSLSAEEVCELQSTGYVDIQSHTMFHVILDMCEDKMAYQEIEKSKEILEEKYSARIFAIAYPNGIYTGREILFVKRAGYICALTTEPGYNDLWTNPYKMKRFGIRDNSNIDEIIIRASGLWGYIKRIKRIITPLEID